MILDLSNHDCLYTADIPSDIHYEHIKVSNLHAIFLSHCPHLSHTAACHDGHVRDRICKHMAVHVH